MSKDIWVIKDTVGQGGIDHYQNALENSKRAHRGKNSTLTISATPGAWTVTVVSDSEVKHERIKNRIKKTATVPTSV